jgi:hypothetical protein
MPVGGRITKLRVTSTLAPSRRPLPSFTAAPQHQRPHQPPWAKFSPLLLYPRSIYACPVRLLRSQFVGGIVLTRTAGDGAIQEGLRKISLRGYPHQLSDLDPNIDRSDRAERDLRMSTTFMRPTVELLATIAGGGPGLPCVRCCLAVRMTMIWIVGTD